MITDQNLMAFELLIPKEPTPLAEVLGANFAAWKVPPAAFYLALAMIELAGGDDGKAITRQELTSKLQTILEQIGGTVLRYDGRISSHNN